MLARPVRLGVALLLTLAVSACAGRGGIPREPFSDVPVPASFIPYSDQWVLIRTPQATAARLIYMTELNAEGALTAARELLVANGWSAGLLNRGTTPDGYKLVVVELGKAADTIRLTVREGANATHVELAVARVIPR